MKKILIGLIIASTIATAGIKEDLEKRTKSTGQNIEVLETTRYGNIFYQRIIIKHKDGKSEQWWIRYTCDGEGNILNEKKYK